MSIKDRFCPRCGRPSENEELCTHCRVENTKWYSCDRRVMSTHCPNCSAIKVGKTWTDTSRERADLAVDLAKSGVHLHPDVKKPVIDVTVEDINLNRSVATLHIRGHLYQAQVEETCTIEIVWHKEQCDRCNRISGSYYEGVVQVRADGRIPSAYEIQMASGIAQQVEDSLQAGGERLSFISDLNEIRDGLDITIGSQHIGTMISRGIIAQLGGRYTTHPKLVGEKNGRQLFRITYSVRLPRFQKEDVIACCGRYAQVERVESHHIRVMDLTDGLSRSVREEDVEGIIGNARNAESALVAFVDKNTMGILDPETHKTRESKKLSWLDAGPGEHVSILRDGENLVVVR